MYIESLNPIHGHTQHTQIHTDTHTHTHAHTHTPVFFSELLGEGQILCPSVILLVELHPIFSDFREPPCVRVCSEPTLCQLIRRVGTEMEDRQTGCWYGQKVNKQVY